MALIDYNNGTATISVNGGQPPFSYLLKQGGVAATHDGANFVNPIISSNQSVVFGDSSDLTGSYGMPSGTYTCEITDNNGCIVTTSEIVISQTEEATTTQATAATTLATAATTLATIPTTPATDATTLATDATTIATNATTEATDATTEATDATTIATNPTTLATNATTIATNPTTLATNATTEATLATTEATAATTEATDATTIATNATTEATAATTIAPSYDSLTVQSQLNEGQVALFTLTGTNIPNGATVGYFLTGIDPGDLQDPSAMTGTFTMSNNMDQHTIAIASDFLTEGLETMYLELDATDSNGVTAGLTASVDIIDTSLNPTTLATAATTIATPATTIATSAPLEHTFYHFHAGGGTVAPYSDLSVGGNTFYTSTGAGTQDLSVMMADLIENGDGQTSSAQVAMPLVTSFEFSGPITGNDCGTSWTSNVSSGPNFFWLAVPNNADFTEDLTVDGVLQYDCNALTYNANSKTPFTYNGENYWLYKLAAATSENAQTYGFK